MHPPTADARALATVAPRLRRRVAVVAGALVAATAVVAVLHLGPLRHGLRAVGGCPVGANLSAAEHDAFRLAQQRSLVGEGAAPARDVADLGVELERTSRDSVRAWARARGAACEATHAETALTCSGVSGLEGVRDVFFRFDAAGRVVGADIMHSAGTPEDGARVLARVTKDLRATLGAPTSSHGELTVAGLAEPGGAAGIAYRFRDLAVDVTALHGEDGVVVRRQFRSLAQ